MKFLFAAVLLLDLAMGLIMRLTNGSLTVLAQYRSLPEPILFIFLVVFVWYRQKQAFQLRKHYERILQEEYSFYQNIQIQKDAVHQLRHDLANHLQVLGNLVAKPSGTGRAKVQAVSSAVI